MGIIRSFNILDINSLKNMKNYLGNDFSGFRFWPDSYVAIDNNKIKGMISLCQRRNNKQKWKIKNLLLTDDNFTETGKNLVDYVISKYSSKGVETFEVEISPEYKNIVELFSKSCGFRYCLDYKIYEIKTSYYRNRISDTQKIIYRPFKNSDKKDVADLYNLNISPYYKFPLSKTPEEFCDNLFKGLNRKESLKFILEDKFSKKIIGFINILTEDNKNFVMNIVILSSFESYIEDSITFAISQISKKTKSFSLFFKNCKFHLNSDIFEKTLSEIDNELIRTDLIFVKDFFREIKDTEKTKNSSIIYTELNGKPAYKI